MTDEKETLLWSIMRRFERQAVAQYRASAPDLLGEDKLALLGQLEGCADVLDDSELGAPMASLLAAVAAAAGDAKATLIVQGLLLERVRASAYRIVAASPSASDETRARAALGLSASVRAAQAAPPLLARHATGDALFSRFAESTDEVLARLDAVGEGVDRIFGARFELRFCELVADMVSELVPATVTLGMNRRKVMCHLAGALMGL